jgi:hypothetical protein
VHRESAYSIAPIVSRVSKWERASSSLLSPTPRGLKRSSNFGRRGLLGNPWSSHARAYPASQLRRHFLVNFDLTCEICRLMCHLRISLEYMRAICCFDCLAENPHTMH